MKRVKFFPNFGIILKQQLREKKEKALIADYIRSGLSTARFAKSKNMERAEFSKICKKHSINAGYIHYSYDNIVKILTEYLETKLKSRIIVRHKYDISYRLIWKWKKHFLVHKDNKGKVKLILIDKDWERYKLSLKQKDKVKALKLPEHQED